MSCWLWSASRHPRRLAGPKPYISHCIEEIHQRDPTTTDWLADEDVAGNLSPLCPAPDRPFASKNSSWTFPGKDQTSENPQLPDKFTPWPHPNWLMSSGAKCFTTIFPICSLLDSLPPPPWCPFGTWIRPQSMKKWWYLLIVFNCNKRLEISIFVYFASTLSFKAVSSTDKTPQKTTNNIDDLTKLSLSPNSSLPPPGQKVVVQLILWPPIHSTRVDFRRCLQAKRFVENLAPPSFPRLLHPGI